MKLTPEYEDVVQSAREVGFEVECIALEVGSFTTSS